MFNPNREEVQPKPRGFNDHEVSGVDQVIEEAAQEAEPLPVDPQP